MSTRKNVVIIAEAGVNHNGSLKLARKLIDKASEAKADFIKFQTFKAESITTKLAKKANYQISKSKKNETQFQMLKKLELSENSLIKIFEYCKFRKIKMLSSPFDIESFNFLKNFNMEYIKIPSGEITNLPLLEKIGNYRRKIILSTGMSNISDIRKAINVLNVSGTSKNRITLLHCNTEYPTPFEDTNLNAIKTLQKKFKLDVGYSDHTIGIEASIAAVAVGAKIIEKHFTLDKKSEGPDHASSLEPTELITMIKGIRNIEVAMGSGEKKPSSSEIKNIKIARKSIVAKKNISINELFTDKNLTVKRPAIGISPMKWHEVIGKKAKINYRPDDIIKK